MNTFIKIVIVVCILFAVGLLLNIGLEKSARVTCTTLKDQAEKYPLWYATENEREMCKFLGMELPADNAPAPTSFNPILDHSEIK